MQRGHRAEQPLAEGGAGRGAADREVGKRIPSRGDRGSGDLMTLRNCGQCGPREGSKEHGQDSSQAGLGRLPRGPQASS